MRALWALADQQAQRQVQQARQEARDEVAALQRELAEADGLVARLEQVESERAALVNAQSAGIRKLELELAQAREQVGRLAGLEQSLVQARAELDAARQELVRSALDIGQLRGEVEVLRAQRREPRRQSQRTAQDAGA